MAGLVLSTFWVVPDASVLGQTLGMPRDWLGPTGWLIPVWLMVLAVRLDRWARWASYVLVTRRVVGAGVLSLAVVLAPLATPALWLAAGIGGVGLLLAGRPWQVLRAALARGGQRWHVIAPVLRRHLLTSARLLWQRVRTTAPLLWRRMRTGARFSWRRVLAGARLLWRGLRASTRSSWRGLLATARWLWRGLRATACLLWRLLRVVVRVLVDPLLVPPLTSEQTPPPSRHSGERSPRRRIRLPARLRAGRRPKARSVDSTAEPSQ